MIAKIHNAEISGEIHAPPSKSHTIRAVLIAALAEGSSIIENCLNSDDTQACIRAVSILGAEVDFLNADAGGAGVGGVDVGGEPASDMRARENVKLRVRGIGSRRGDDGIFHLMPENVIDVGNSGTTLFLLAGIAALSRNYLVLTGDNQIRRRSAEKLLSALRCLGADAFSTRENGCAPLIIRGPLSGGKIELECPVSQYLSSLMLACPLMPAGSAADIHITLLNERPYAEMTERWLQFQGIEFKNDNWERIRIPGGQSYRAFQRAIPGDFSGATFFACAAALSGGRLTLRGLDMSDSQGDKAVFSILEKMGCSVNYRQDSITIAAPSASSQDASRDSSVLSSDSAAASRDSAAALRDSAVLSNDSAFPHSPGLRGGTFDLNEIPDALPALAITAAFAGSETRLVNVPQARMKETDRIQCMAAELSKMGVPVQELRDGLIIRPGQKAGQRYGRGAGRGAGRGRGQVREAGGTAELPRGAELD
ncbi:MAG: 3-phosphoshikimate 1-carboxyvinyltransferase, partial [Salinispira sp.]